ncbi:MAG TPA: triple tyrosine motif-containing protein [Steroidobacteraceae bacterium]
MLRSFALPVLQLVACTSGAADLDSPKDIPYLYHQSWRARDGAPTGITALAQSSDGMLWLAAHGGLYRFDGTHFSPVRWATLPVRESRALFAPRGGGVWISYLHGGASFIQGGRARTFSKADGLPEVALLDFVEGADGAIWAASAGGLFRFSQGRWEDVTGRYGLGGRTLKSVCIDPDGTVWVLAGEAVLYLKSGADRFEPTPWKTNVDGRLARSREGVPWIVTLLDGHAVALRLSLRTIIHPSAEDRVWLKEQENIDLVEHGGPLWMDSGTALARREPDRLPPSRRYPASDKRDYPFERLSGPSVQAALEDREGDIWLATQGGIDKFRASRIHRFPGVTGEVVMTVAGTDTLWAGLDRSPTQDQALYEVRIGSGAQKVPGLENVSAGYASRAGDVWVSGPNRLWHLQQDRWQVIAGPKVPSDHSEAQVLAIVADPEEHLWISVAGAGLFKRTGEAWAQYVPSNIEQDASPLVMAWGENGALWLGYSSDRIIAINRSEEHAYAREDGIDAGGILTIASVAGRLWIGGNRGVDYFDGHRFNPLHLTIGSSIPYVSGILQSRGGDVWLNAADGVIHVRAADLGSWSKDPSALLRAELLDHLDGLWGSPNPARSGPTIAEGGDGKIWFATSNGLYWTTPGEPMRDSIPPAVLITKIIADGIDLDLTHPLLGANPHQLEVDYTATSLAVPERVKFRYRLVGHDAEWQDAGTRRSAYYSDLPPGQYLFRVIACNDLGLWNEVGQGVRLRVPPTLAQSTQFRIFGFIVAALLLFNIILAYLRRIRLRMRRHLEQRFITWVDERTRIARDIPDGLLQHLQALMFRVQAARQFLPARGIEAAALLDTALESGDEAISKGRESVRDLWDPTLTETDLGQALAGFGVEFSQTSPAPAPLFHVMVEGDSRPFNSLVRDEVYRFAREAIRNAFRHSRASKIEAEIVYGQARFCLRVRDNGIGMSAELLATSGPPTHTGLAGLRQRASILRGEFNVWSQPGAGTEVELKLPSRRAYCRAGRLQRLLQARSAE